VEATTEQLEVVCHDYESTRHDEGHERRRDCHGADDSDRDRAGEAREREPPQQPVGKARPERAAVQLVESVSANADSKQEGSERRNEAIDVNRRRGGSPERDIAEVPGGVWRMKQCDEVAPAAGPQRIERRPLELRLRRRP
jgi:hypothetical protein